MNANYNETVREVCADMKDLELVSSDGRFPVVRVKRIFANASDRILAAHTRELAAKEEMSRIAVRSAQAMFHGEMAAKDAEIARLKAAMKQVMECNAELDIEMACCFDDDCINGDVCDEYKGKRCWVKFLHAVREAQRIMREGGEK